MIFLSQSSQGQGPKVEGTLLLLYAGFDRGRGCWDGGYCRGLGPKSIFDVGVVLCVFTVVVVVVVVGCLLENEWTIIEEDAERLNLKGGVRREGE